MGYTHYWTGNGAKLDASRFAKFAQVAKKVVDLATSRGIKLADTMGEGTPEINDTIVAFNGVGDDSHESFIVAQGQTGFEFCKTACKPYDIVVVAILVIYKHFFPEINFSSDGSLGELEDGVKLASEAMGTELELIEEANGYSVTTASNKAEVVFSAEELVLLQQAVSFLTTHIAEAEDELDVEIDRKKIDALEAKLYGK